MDDLVDRHRATILAVARRHGAESVAVFGSRARDEAGPASDVDLLVRFEPGRTLLDFAGLKNELEDLLGCPVDLVTEGALSPYLREQVLATAKPLEAA